MNDTEIRKVIKTIMFGYPKESEAYQALYEVQKRLKYKINTEYAAAASQYVDTDRKPILIESFSNSIFKTYEDQEDDKWYILRCTYVEETNNGYVYNIGRRPTLTNFAEHVEQNINVKLSQRPTENDLENIWKEAVRK